MTETYKIIYEAVKQIPKGKIATYGQIAKIAGNKNLSRVVGNALHKNPDPATIPCHRVVNSQGKLSQMYAFGGIEKQAQLLTAEGIRVINNKVDLKTYQWTEDNHD